MRTAPTLVVALLLAAAPALAVDAHRLALARAAAGKGEKLLAKEKPAEAEKRFREAIDHEPAYPAGYLGLGAALVGQQRFDDAVTVLEEAKERYVTWEQRVRETEMQARQDAAQRAREFADLRRAQQQKAGPNPAQPNPAQTLTAMAFARVATEEYIAKRGWEQETFLAIPAQVFYLEGISYLRTGQRDKGIAELEACLSLDSSHALAHYNLAVALFTSGQTLPAKEHLDAAIAGGVTPNPRFAADVESAARALRP